MVFVSRVFRLSSVFKTDYGAAIPHLEILRFLCFFLRSLRVSSFLVFLLIFWFLAGTKAYAGNLPGARRA